MNEITSVIRLKERIIIAILLSAFALLIAVSAGVVAVLTKDNTPDSGINGGDLGNNDTGSEDSDPTDDHTHTYEYQMVKNDEGGFDFIGNCTVASCKNPGAAWHIESGIIEQIKVQPTCLSLGEKVYSFTSPFDQKTYTYTEEMPYAPHNLVGVVDSTDASVINVSCATEGCDVTMTASVSSLVSAGSDPATCGQQREYYSYTADGETVTVSIYKEVDEYDHILNGTLSSEFYIYDGVYAYGTEGIVTTNPLVGCGQKTAGSFICEGCGQAVGVIVGTVPHNYDYSALVITKQPDFSQTGEAKVSCTNEDCTHEAKIALPKAVEGDNTTLVVTDEENKKQVWTYIYTPDNYEYTFEFQFETPWEHDHIYVYDESQTKNPTLLRDGEFIVKCTLCGVEKKHTLPKINEGVNANPISNATEQKPKTYEYFYESQTYGFTLVLEIEVGEKLSHSYVYELVPYQGGFALAGHCQNEFLGCTEIDIITKVGLVPEKEYTAPTCSQWGEETWFYIDENGVRYELSFPIPPETGIHSFVCDLSNTIYPTFENNGSAILKCSGEGCDVKTEMITLPKAVLGSNATLNEETRMITYTFKLTYDGMEFTASVEYPLTEEHTHHYTFELVPMENADIGKFDFVGTCTYPLCTSKITESNVNATLVEDNSGCTTGIKQLWSYEKNGETYYCNLDIWVPDGHHMDYVPNSPTTVNPTLTESGSIEIHCTKCSETYILELPSINDPAVIVESTRETERQISYSYIYHYVYNEFDPDGFLDIDLIIVVSK